MSAPDDSAAAAAATAAAEEIETLDDVLDRRLADAGEQQHHLTHVQCAFCAVVVDIVRSTRLFDAMHDNRYVLRCAVGTECGAASICEHCWALATTPLGGDGDGGGGRVCMRCAPHEWHESRQFGIHYHFAFTDRNRLAYDTFLQWPHTSASRREALDAAVAYVPAVLTTRADAALGAAMRAAADQALRSQIDALCAEQQPVVVLPVPQASTDEAAGRITIVCFPLNVQRVRDI